MSIRISLNIANDCELRAYIKEMIKGQILSVAREEIRAVITEALQKAMKLGSIQATVQQLAKEEVQRSSPCLELKRAATEYVNKELNAEIQKRLDELDVAAALNHRLKKIRLELGS